MARTKATVRRLRQQQEKPLLSKGNGLFFSVRARSREKVKNFSDSAAEADLNYGCYKEFINILITLQRLHLGQTI